MFQKRCLRIGVLASILIFGFLVGCGPSTEKQAATSVALTATAATNTPTPTLTPTPTDTSTPTSTPVPYDLSVVVTGEEDAPIVGANVVLEEVGDETGTQITDEVGQAFWYDLPGETISLSIRAQGYFPLDMTDSVERGINQITVALERDPHGLLPSEACAPGEKLLYIEDFQDGEPQDWPGIEYRMQGWEITPHPDSPGNIVAQNTDREAHTYLHDHKFDNAVWRFKFMYSGSVERIGAGWKYVNEAYDNEKGEEVELSWYAIWIAPLDRGLGFGRCQFGCLDLGGYGTRHAIREWHDVEIGTYQNQLGVWLDGRRYMKYDDPIPLPAGTLMLEVSIPRLDDQSVVYFDDFSVCELTAPIGTTPTPES